MIDIAIRIRCPISDYDMKDEKLTPYKRMIDTFMQYIDDIIFRRVPKIQVVDFPSLRVSM